MDCMRDDFQYGKLLDNRFLTIAPLNHGSFGMVFTAKDTKTGEDVAIKCMTKPGAANVACPATIAVDERSEELAIHSRLLNEHPNIVNLIHHFETDNHQYMVLELCSNGDLYEAIRVGRGPLETEHVRDFMLQLVNAIDHLHSNGVYHRDIKPENIFLTSSGTMKLGDFGLATTDTWSTEFAVGSDRYMAPEQFDASVYGYGYSPAAADVWAIGIVLLNIIFQRNPFATPTQKDPLFADFARDRQSLFDVFPNMSQDTYNILVHSLALDPAYRSLAAVREALKEAVSFTTDDEALDDFCTAEPTPLMPSTTVAREPLRTPSITSPNMNQDSFPWASALLKTPQKPARQLSTIRDDESELFPGSVKSEWQYVDTDEASLSSALDSGLGMSYKSSKSAKSLATKATSNFVGSLPISFSRPSNKNNFPYSTTGNGFSKSWSDLWDEDEELENQQQQESTSFEDGVDIERVDTAKPSTPQLHAIREEDRGSVTPRQGLIERDANIRTATASPLRRLVEEDKKREQSQSPKQRSSSILDKWAALGNFRRAKVEPSPSVTATPTQKTKYSDAFATFSPFSTSKKQSAEQPVPIKSRDRATSWRQGSPTRLRSTSMNNSRVWERKEKEHSPNGHTAEAWSKDTNWRQHMSPAAIKTTSSPPAPATSTNNAFYAIPGQQHRKQSPEKSKNFLDHKLAPLDDVGDLEWVGGWHDFHI